MKNNIELRREHVKLVQRGKTKEAFAKLKEIWAIEANPNNNQPAKKKAKAEPKK